MFKDKTVLGGILLLLVGVVVAVGLWALVLRAPAPAGGPIEAVPLTSQGGATAVAGATTTIMRQDYDLRVPVVRNVADVDEAVTLELDFVATAGQ